MRMTANLCSKDLALGDYGHAGLRFANGAVGSVADTSTSLPGAPREALEAVGSRSVIIWDTAKDRLALTGDFGLDGWITLNAIVVRKSYVDQVIRCLRGEEPPVSTVDGARTSLVACLVVYAWVQTGRAVGLIPAGVT